MDIEQLKLILQTVGDATEAGAWIAILYFTLNFLKLPLVFFIVGKYIVLPTVQFICESYKNGKS